MKENLLSVIVPVYNEEKYIEEIINRISGVILPPGWSKELIIIDDKSTDETTEILHKYEKTHNIVYRQKNGGKGAALRDGFEKSQGDYILIQDADLEYDPNDYNKLLNPIINNQSDIVFGSRILGKNNVPYKRIYFYGGVFLTQVFNIFFGTKLTDVSTCYKVFNKKYLDPIMKFHADDFVFDFTELTYALVSHGKVIEVPINYNPRSSEGGKKLKIRHGINILMSLIGLFCKKYVSKFK